MDRICFPHPDKGDFATFRGAYRTLHQPNYFWADHMITYIVQYNVCYRDYLRENGIDSLIDMMCKDLPELAKDEKCLECLRRWSENTPLADYDVQCYHVDAKVDILEHIFNGFNDIRNSVELLCHIGYGDELTFVQQDGSVNGGDIHVGLFSTDYPIFDHYDLGDDRTYQNYVFSRKPLTEVEMRRIYDTIPKMDVYMMVHEQIPEENLPVLWYSGDGKHIILASAK